MRRHHFLSQRLNVVPIHKKSRACGQAPKVPPYRSMNLKLMPMHRTAPGCKPHVSGRKVCVWFFPRTVPGLPYPPKTLRPNFRNICCPTPRPLSLQAYSKQEISIHMIHRSWKPMSLCQLCDHSATGNSPFRAAMDAMGGDDLVISRVMGTVSLVIPFLPVRCARFLFPKF